MDRLCDLELFGTGLFDEGGSFMGSATLALAAGLGDDAGFGQAVGDAAGDGVDRRLRSIHRA